MPIVNDNIAEDTEDFFSTLTTTDPDVFLGPDEARAIILSDRKFYRHSAPMHYHSTIIGACILQCFHLLIQIFVSSHIHKT